MGAGGLLAMGASYGDRFSRWPDCGKEREAFWHSRDVELRNGVGAGGAVWADLYGCPVAFGGRGIGSVHLSAETGFIVMIRGITLTMLGGLTA